MDDQRKAIRDSLHEYGGHEHVEHLGDLHAELDREEPRPAQLAAEFERLRAEPSMEFMITSWWNDPKTQSFIAELNALGI